MNRRLVYELAGGQFINRREDVLFLGPPGTGKSHLAQAIGRAAIQQGVRVLYREAHVLVEKIADAVLDGTRKECLDELVTVPLLIIDDLGMRKLPATAAEDLLELVMRRYERASTVVTSNRPVDDWGKLFGDTAAVASDPRSPAPPRPRLKMRSAKLEDQEPRELATGRSCRLDEPVPVASRMAGFDPITYGRTPVITRRRSLRARPWHPDSPKAACAGGPVPQMGGAAPDADKRFAVGCTATQSTCSTTSSSSSSSTSTRSCTCEGTSQQVDAGRSGGAWVCPVTTQRLLRRCAGLRMKALNSTMLTRSAKSVWMMVRISAAAVGSGAARTVILK